jgi:type I restriction enzyme S subunit
VESLEQRRISNTEIPLPPREEQHAIAAYLDRETERIDALIEKKEQLIDLLEEKRQSLISHVVTRGLDDDVEMKNSGVEWLGKIPVGWNTVKLKWNTSKIGSGVTPDGGGEAYVDEGITFLRSQNVHFDGLRLDDVVFIDEETDEEMEATRVQPWDVLLNITGASIGRCALVPKNFPQANVNQHVCIIRAQQDEIHPLYLNHVIASSVGQEQISAETDGASRDAVTFAEVGNFVVPKPPTEEQHQIADQIER